MRLSGPPQPHPEPAIDDTLEVAPLGPEKAGTERLFSQIVDRLAVDIVAGRYRAGDLLPNENNIDIGVSISRTAYREAIKFLSAKGLIDARPRSGTRVRAEIDWNLLDPDILRWSLAAQPSRKFIRDLFELRRYIEPNAARLAATRRSELDCERIAAALHDMELNEPMSDAAIAADIRFHEAVFDATGNAAFNCLKTVVATTVLWSQRVKHHAGAEPFITSLANHRRILDAIVNRDGELAAAQTVLLVVEALNSTEAALTPDDRPS